MTDNPRALLAAQNAAVRLVLSGYQSDDAGWATALGDVGAAIVNGEAIWADIAVSVRWALAALPRSFYEPTDILDWLAATYSATIAQPAAVDEGPDADA